MRVQAHAVAMAAVQAQIQQQQAIPAGSLPLQAPQASAGLLGYGASLPATSYGGAAQHSQALGTSYSAALQRSYAPDAFQAPTNRHQVLILIFSQHGKSLLLIGICINFSDCKSPRAWYKHWAVHCSIEGGTLILLLILKYHSAVMARLLPQRFTRNASQAARLPHEHHISRMHRTTSLQSTQVFHS